MSVERVFTEAVIIGLDKPIKVESLSWLGLDAVFNRYPTLFTGGFELRAKYYLADVTMKYYQGELYLISHPVSLFQNTTFASDVCELHRDLNRRFKSVLANKPSVHVGETVTLSQPFGFFASFEVPVKVESKTEPFKFDASTWREKVPVEINEFAINGILHPALKTEIIVEFDVYGRNARVIYPTVIEEIIQKGVRFDFDVNVETPCYVDI